MFLAGNFQGFFFVCGVCGVHVYVWGMFVYVCRPCPPMLTHTSNFNFTSRWTRFARHWSVKLTLLNSKLYVLTYLIPFRKIQGASGIVKGLECQQSLKAVRASLCYALKIVLYTNLCG